MTRPDIAIVMAAGDATRWGDYLGSPKHLVEIEGEPILHRTVRLLQEEVPEVWVVAKDDARYREHGGKTLTVIPRESDVDKFYSSKDLWAGRNALLVYGDCYLSQDTINLMTGPQEHDWRLFCRVEASSYTGCNYGECFGYYVASGFADRFRHTCEWLAGMYALGMTDRVGGWEVYRALMGYPLDMHYWDDVRARVIDDWTEDFDYPVDYDMWIENRRRARG